MELIMNEKKYVEHILRTGNLGSKPGYLLYLIAKYYRQVDGVKVKDIEGRLDNMMQEFYPGYNASSWASTIAKAAKQSNSRKLYEIDSIDITKKEMDIIESMKTLMLKRLAMTMICVAKYYDIISGERNGWVNCDPATIFRCSNNVVNLALQAKMYAQLTAAGVITYSNKAGSVSAKVLVLDYDADSPVVYSVHDLSRVGYEYMIYSHTKGYRHCVKCGVAFKGAAREKTCPVCVSEDKLQYNRFICVDCGKEVFLAAKRSVISCRCPQCQAEHNRAIRIESAKRSKQNKKHQIV